MKRLILASALALAVVSIGAGVATAQPVPRPAEAELPSPDSIDALLAALTVYEEEVAELGALGDIDPTTVTLIDVAPFLADADRPRLAAAREGLDPAALLTFLENDPALVALFAAADLNVAAVIAVTVAEDGAVVFYTLAEA